MSSDLSSINSATLGAKFPEVTLPDGTKVQTGTIGALLTNIKAYDALHAETPAEQMSNEQKMHKLEFENKFRAALPMLMKAGIFGLFSAEEWVNGVGGQSSPGRRFVGNLAIKAGVE